MQKLIGDKTRQVTVTKSDEEVLVHDGKRVHVRSGEGTTGVGDPTRTVCVGTPEEIDAEIARLGLVTAGEMRAEPGA
jgi:hypothetical protein